MSGLSIAPAKRLSHHLKRAFYRRASLDAWFDDHVGNEDTSGGLRRWSREKLLHRLFPERRLRSSPFVHSSDGHAGHARILTLIPPEDTGGGSRPAQLAAELHRRGFSIEWRWALPIFPWPRLRRPAVAHVDAQHIDDAPPAGTADLVLVEAPHPQLVELAFESDRSGPVVYDAIDEWDGTLGAGWYDETAEARLIANADYLISSAVLLRETLAERSGREVALLPNAVDSALFDPERATRAPIARGTPTVLYVGALWGEWVDLEAIQRLATAIPDAAIHLIGPAGSRVLPTARNIYTHGAVERRHIPDLLAAADVTIIPFVPNRLTAAVSPLKAFEYLAMERPVVSTDLPDLAHVPGVTIATNTDDFVRAVADATTAPFPREAVRSFVANQTWERRIDRLLELTRSGR